MVLKLIASLIKWPLVGLTVAGLTYTNHDRVEKVVHGLRFYDSNVEEGFVDKRRSLRLEVKHSKNNEGNLETYLKLNENNLPIYSRKYGIMVGSAQYNFSNFTPKERAFFCYDSNTAKNTKIPKDKKSKSLFSEMYDLLTD
ncbi:hypothetical protein HYU23_01640 [Candidatus Woesearchaeota archaeon]|nr:hypothetical protein [Candidatus Woesearchaeota archaeon]